MYENAAVFGPLLLLFTSLVWGQDYTCEEMLAVEKDFSQKLPLQVDDVTTLVEVSVNCETKVVKYVKHIAVKGNVLDDGFQERKQRQYLNLHCNKQGFARFGWTAMDFIYDMDMNLIMQLRASPESCPDRDDIR